VAVICDNVIIHRSKIVQRWLAAHPRLRVLHGARYSPHDNPVERIWGVLKAWLANNPTLTIQGRVRQVHAFFRQRTTAQMLATAAPRMSRSLWNFGGGPSGDQAASSWVGVAALMVASSAACSAGRRCGRGHRLIRRTSPRSRRGRGGRSGGAPTPP
jgi:DDE superfamily endonuclease